MARSTLKLYQTNCFKKKNIVVVGKLSVISPEEREKKY